MKEAGSADWFRGRWVSGATTGMGMCSIMGDDVDL